MSILINGFAKYSKLRKPFRIILWLLICTMFTLLLSWYCAMKFHNNLIVMHTFALVSIPFYSCIYYFGFDKTVWRKTTIGAFSLAFIISLLYAVYIDHFSSFPSFTLHILSFCIIPLSLIIFGQMLNAPLNMLITRRSEFWLFVALFFYHTSTISLWAVFNYLMNNQISTNVLNQTNWILSITYYVLIGFAVWIETKQALKNEQ